MTAEGKTIPYRPSNGTEGEIFMEHFCFRCERDAKHRADPESDDGCPIIAYMMAFNIGDKEYPKELVRDEISDITLMGGEGARCTAFILEGAETPYRCSKTADLFS